MEHAGLTVSDPPVHRLHVGATSYVVAGDLITNARRLAGHVADMELVLFDLPGGPCNLPSARQVAELAAISQQSGLTYTVHLPADLPAQPSNRSLQPVLARAQQVIECTLGLEPFAYVFHMDGKDVRAAEPLTSLRQRWQEDAIRTLELLRSWVGDDERLALENVEGYPLDFWDALTAAVPVTRCIDVGHLWLDGHDPLPYLARWLAQTRVIHLHGLTDRDHVSLIHTPSVHLDPVIALLLGRRFGGVLTLEVFEEDFETSLAAVRRSLARLESRA